MAEETEQGGQRWGPGLWSMWCLGSHVRQGFQGEGRQLGWTEGATEFESMGLSGSFDESSSQQGGSRMKGEELDREGRQIV